MKTYNVTQQRQRDAQNVRLQVGDAETISLDFSPWSRVNGDIDSVTWTVKSGDISVSGTALSSNVASALFTASQRTRARVVAKATSGNQTLSYTFIIKVIEPIDLGTYDYGFITNY